jgi:hypothetical protein
MDTLDANIIKRVIRIIKVYNNMRADQKQMKYNTYYDHCVLSDDYGEYFGFCENDRHRLTSEYDDAIFDNSDEEYIDSSYSDSDMDNFPLIVVSDHMNKKKENNVWSYPHTNNEHGKQQIIITNGEEGTPLNRNKSVVIQEVPSDIIVDNVSGSTECSIEDIPTISENIKILVGENIYGTILTDNVISSYDNNPPDFGDLNKL